MAMKMILSVLLTASVAAVPAAAQPANPFSERLQTLSELQRHSVLRRAILDSGQPCKRVDAAGVSGRYKNLVMWTARCTPGGAYGVYIGPDASVQVRPCGQAKTLGLPECRLPVAVKR
jgi:hypothetical protein